MVSILLKGGWIKSIPTTLPASETGIGCRSGGLSNFYLLDKEGRGFEVVQWPVLWFFAFSLGACIPPLRRSHHIQSVPTSRSCQATGCSQLYRHPPTMVGVATVSSRASRPQVHWLGTRQDSWRLQDSHDMQCYMYIPYIGLPFVPPKNWIPRLLVLFSLH